jgi:hypothetical protein
VAPVLILTKRNTKISMAEDRYLRGTVTKNGNYIARS